MGYIPSHALPNLRRYTYRAVDKSLVAHYILNPFWNWLVKFWPTWVAPNVITLSGFSLVFMNFLTLLYYDPGYLAENGGAEGPPQWIYFTWAIGLFLYQSFDGIDGKQARRTGMASPLGEMFDHGCDALNTALEVVLACRALNLGQSWWTVASLIASSATFYMTTWEEYHTGQLYLSIFSGPSEGILMIVCIYLITGVRGPTFWDTGVLTLTRLDRLPIITRFVPNMGLNVAFMWFGGFGLAFNVVTSYCNVYRSCKMSGPNPYAPLVHLVPLLTTVTLQVCWLFHPSVNNSDIVHSDTLLPFICAWGLQFAQLVGRIILAHITKMGFPCWHSIWIWNFIGALDANMPRLIGRSPFIQSSPERQKLFVLATLLLSFVSHVRFCTLVIKEITDYLGIACFTVRKRNEDGQWSSPDSVMLSGKSN